MEFGVSAEYHSLRKVLMFRPGKEIAKVSIHSYKELSFRGVAYWRRFQQEHDAFCDLLRGEKVKVILLNDLLTDEDFTIINPNMVYTRDSCSITSAGNIQMRMTHQVRTAEPMIVTRALEQIGIPQLLSIKSPGLIEGGELVYPNESTLMIGFGSRSNEEGALQIANGVLGKTVKTVILVPLPSWRPHLDGGLMFIDKDLFIYHPASVETFPVRIMRENEPVEVVPLMEFLRESYDAEGVPISDNELYLFGANVICLDRKKIVIFECNEGLIEKLKQRDVEVLPIQGSELIHGGGGPHCATQPILRKK
ncbi:MAG: dimethylarginine dimethylaminohydrolase family protein [Candidatus Hodarchaeales archaeon]|jgi:arginine deiminase